MMLFQEHFTVQCKLLKWVAGGPFASRAAN